MFKIFIRCENVFKDLKWFLWEEEKGTGSGLIEFFCPHECTQDWRDKSQFELSSDSALG